MTNDMATEPIAEPIAEPIIEVEVTDNDVVITSDDRHYRIRGLEKQLNPERLKVRITASRRDLAHVDTLDLYVSRLRKTFIRVAAAELYVEQDTIKRDLGRLLLKLEELQEEQIRYPFTASGRERSFSS